MPSSIHSPSPYFPTLAPDLTNIERKKLKMDIPATPEYLRITANMTIFPKPIIGSARELYYTRNDGETVGPIGLKALARLLRVSYKTIQKALEGDGKMPNGGVVHEGEKE